MKERQHLYKLKRMILFKRSLNVIHVYDIDMRYACYPSYDEEDHSTDIWDKYTNSFTQIIKLYELYFVELEVHDDIKYFKKG